MTLFLNTLKPQNLDAYMCMAGKKDACICQHASSSAGPEVPAHVCAHCLLVHTYMHMGGQTETNERATH